MKLFYIKNVHTYLYRKHTQYVCTYVYVFNCAIKIAIRFIYIKLIFFSLIFYKFLFDCRSFLCFCCHKYISFVYEAYIKINNNMFIVIQLNSKF